MIKIIEHGNTHRRKRCEDCGCVFEFDNVDFRYYPSTEDYRMLCPECGAVIVIEVKGEK